MASLIFHKSYIAPKEPLTNCGIKRLILELASVLGQISSFILTSLLIDRVYKDYIITSAEHVGFLRFIDGFALVLPVVILILLGSILLHNLYFWIFKKGRTEMDILEKEAKMDENPNLPTIWVINKKMSLKSYHFMILQILVLVEFAYLIVVLLNAKSTYQMNICAIVIFCSTINSTICCYYHSKDLTWIIPALLIYVLYHRFSPRCIDEKKFNFVTMVPEGQFQEFIENASKAKSPIIART